MHLIAETSQNTGIINQLPQCGAVDKVIKWSADQKAQVIAALFACAQDRVDIFTNSLDPLVFNNLRLKSEVINFLSKPDRTLCVVVSDFLTPRFAFTQEISTRKHADSSFMIFNSNHYCDGFPSFFIADQISYVLDDEENNKRVFNTYDPDTAHHFANLFDQAVRHAKRVI